MNQNGIESLLVDPASTNLPFANRYLLIQRGASGYQYGDLCVGGAGGALPLGPSSDSPYAIGDVLMVRRLGCRPGLEIGIGIAGKTVTIDKTAMSALQGYAWPGNVRELENVVERAVALTEGDLISPEDLPRTMQERKSQDRLASAVAQGFTLDQLEREYIERVLEVEGGNKTRAAQRLGLDRKTLYRKLEEYATSPREGEPAGAPPKDPTKANG